MSYEIVIKEGTIAVSKKHTTMSGKNFHTMINERMPSWQSRQAMLAMIDAALCEVDHLMEQHLSKVGEQ
jgi:hypothetical protein